MDKKVAAAFAAGLALALGGVGARTALADKPHAHTLVFRFSGEKCVARSEWKNKDGSDNLSGKPRDASAELCKQAQAFADEGVEP